MSAIKSVNWALAWRRSFWTVSFFAFLGLVVYMARDMANSQPVVFGVIVLSAIVGAVAFVYAMGNKEALLIAVLAVCIHVFLDASYWSSVIDDISTQVMREQSAASARDVVNQKRRDRYAASASGKGAAQLAAEIEALKQDTRWSSTEQCSKATVPASRAFCQDYYGLVAEHAAAKEAANLEQTVFHTTVEAVDLPRNLAKGALWVSDVTGMSVQTATNILVALMVLFIQAGLALSLRIGWAPEKARIDSTAAKPSEATETPAKSLPPVSSVPVRVERKPIVPMIELPEFGTQKAELAPSEVTVPNSGTDPDGDGGPVAKPEDPVDEVAEPVRNVVSLFRDDGEGPKAARAKKKSHKPEGKVESWLGAATTQVDDPTVEVSSEVCWKSYLDYCEATDKQPIGRKRFSRKLGVLTGRKTGNGRKRDAKGSVFSGLMINQAVAAKARRFA